MMDTPMIKISGEDLTLKQPAPYDIYTTEGALLLPRGHSVDEQNQLNILHSQGWRLAEPGEVVTPSESQQLSAFQSVLPENIRLPEQEKPSVEATKVLVVDDMRLIRQLITFMLKARGITRVKAVEDGRKAISYFFRNRPHIVFLDIDMPPPDGLSVLKQIKQWSPDTFVCMVSNNSTLVNVQKANTLKTDAFLVKPINGLNIRRILAMYEQEREKKSES